MNTILKRKLSLSVQARLTRRLATLLDAGIPLPEALSFILKSFSKNKTMQKVFGRLIQKVTTGQLYSIALADEGIFDQSLVNLVSTGESSGSLIQALQHAASMLERRDTVSKKITGIMIYPVFIGVATLGIALFLVVYIFPKIIPLVTSMGIQLPLLTRLLIVVSALLLHHWLIISMCLVTCIFLSILLWKKSKKTRKFARRIIFSFPLLGEMYKGYILIELFGSLGLLLEHGETLPRALASISRGTRYTEFKDSFNLAIQDITRGLRLSASLQQQNIFPSLAIDLVETGERTGGIAHACNNISHIYETETDEIIQRLSRVIEPVLMLAMGGVVGSIALSIVMPIYEITNHLSH